MVFYKTMKNKKLLVLGLLTLFVTSCSAPSISQETTSNLPSSEIVSDSENSTNNTTTSLVENTTSPTTSNETTTGNLPANVEEYYKSITENADSLTDGINGTLRSTITPLIKPKRYFTYSGSGSGKLGSELCDIDEDPKNPNNMYLFYSRDSIKKEKSKNWNREHCWPQSDSNGLYGTDAGPGADALHIRPTAVTVNSARGNKLYGSVNGTGKEVRNNTNYKTNSLSGWTSGNVFEPLDVVKGDCARIVLYMYTCYFESNKLVLTNVATSVKLLLDWNRMDPPDDIELLRNDRVFASRQKNRNPYVDHPEWVERIFG